MSKRWEQYEGGSDEALGFPYQSDVVLCQREYKITWVGLGYMVWAKGHVCAKWSKNSSF